MGESEKEEGPVRSGFSSAQLRNNFASYELCLRDHEPNQQAQHFGVRSCGKPHHLALLASKMNPLRNVMLKSLGFQGGKTIPGKFIEKAESSIRS